MIRKIVSFFITFVLIITTFISHVNAQTFSNTQCLINSSSGYKYSKVFYEDNLKLNLLYNNRDDAKIIIYNMDSGSTVECISKNYGKETRNSFRMTVKNNRIESASIVLQNNALNSTMTNNLSTVNTIDMDKPMVKGISTETNGTNSYVWMDGVKYVTKTDWNPQLGNGVTYTHPDYIYYKVPTYKTMKIEGNKYHNIHLSTNTVANLSGFNAGVVSAAITGLIGLAMASLATPGITIVVGLAAGYGSAALTDKLKDERGCIWLRFDKNPKMKTSYFDYNAGKTRRIYEFSLIQVGPYIKRNVPVGV